MAFVNDPIRTGNFFTDVIDNLQVVIDFYKTTLGIREVLNDDPPVVKNTPLVGITYEEEEEEVVNLSLRRKQIDIECEFEVFLYFENVEHSYKRRQLAEISWNLADILRKHITINGFLTQKCSEVRKVVYEARPRENGIMSGTLIVVNVPYRHCVEGLL